MAQYFQVLSPNGDKTIEELRQYYPNLQYVIAPEENQFQNQKIIVTSSGEQLMLVNNQSEQIIVDQSSVKFQNASQQQVVIQGQKVAYQVQENQQVCYTEVNAHVNKPVMEEQQIQSVPSAPVQQLQQPVVLNHQIQQSPMRSQLVAMNMPKSINTSQRINAELNRPMPGQSQIRQHLQTSAVAQQLQRPPRLPPQPRQQQVRHRLIGPAMGNVPNIIRQSSTPAQSPLKEPVAKYSDAIFIDPPESTSETNTESVVLPDGTVISVADYKRLQQQKKLQQQVARERMQTPALVASPEPKRKPPRQPANRAPRAPRAPRSKPRAKVNVPPMPRAVEGNNRNVPQQQCAVPNQYGGQMSSGEFPQHQPPFQQMPSRSPFVIQPNVGQQQQQQNAQAQCCLPSYIASSQIQQIIENTPVTEEGSIRMLVLLPDGEQRLITFTLPKEACTIYEILEQVDVQVTPETSVAVTEFSHCGLHYVVTVGTPPVHPAPDADATQPGSNAANVPQQELSKLGQVVQTPPREESPPAEAQPPPEVPKFVPGKLAVCGYCGYLSEDFNKCLRCKRKLPDDVKSVPSSGNKRYELTESPPPIQEKKLTLKPNVPKQPNGSPKKKTKKIVEAEPVILTLSSDDEEDTQKPATASEVMTQLTESVSLSAIRKEPSLSDIERNQSALTTVKDDDRIENSILPDITLKIVCRTIRIGSYRFVPLDALKVKLSGISFQVPSLRNPKEIITITIERSQMVKVLASFQKMLPVMFYYVVPSVGQTIREQIGMVEGADPYFDPLAREEAHKRITILPEYVHEDVKKVFTQIYGKPVNIMDELTGKEANDILLKTCPKELSKVISGASFTEIKQLLIYPPGKGGLPINTEDYLCLAQDQFLNDVIIDFYLKHLLLTLPKEQQDKVHVFSTFFYKRLTTKPVKTSRKCHPTEFDTNLTPAQKRHARVKNWTKNVNLFEKDFIIIPINEHCHWFLAIICFPGIDGPVSMDGKPVKLEPKTKKSKPVTATIGNVTITTVKVEKEEKITVCDDPDLSDKDEAEADDSEMDSEEEAEEAPQQPKVDQTRPPIKQPCVLIFDSLAGASRSRVVATLRDYLTCEYKVKMGKEKVFTKDVIKGACPKVPQQTNFTDCGLYLLQYAEQFFKDPIKDYYIPISQLKNWFDEITATKKREDISNLIKVLMMQYGIDTSILPEILLPTFEGKLVEHSHLEDDEDDEGEFPDDELDELLQEEESAESFSTEMDSDIVEKSVDANNTGSEAKAEEPPKQLEFLDEAVPSALLKPAVSEIQRQSNRDTMLYLKTKRITRHKSAESSDTKRQKTSE